MTTKDFQNSMTECLRNVVPENCEVVSEWVAFNGFHNHYSPRVDIAIGPFSVSAGQNKIQEYDSLLNHTSIRTLLERIYEFHKQNIGREFENEIEFNRLERLIHVNANARCFLAFEIENNNSKKHILGSIVNAASLGRIGIGVAYNDRTLRTFIRLLNYLGFLKRVEKNTYDTTNFLIITKEQMELLFNENLSLENVR